MGRRLAFCRPFQSMCVLEAYDMSLRAIGYIRVSDRKSAESGLSLADQEKAIRAACERQGWQVIGMRVEAGKSAWTEKSRPEFNAMMADAKSAGRNFDVIAVLNLSRFSRDTIAQEVAIADLAQVGVRVYPIQLPLDDSATSKMVRTIIGSINELSSATTSENVKRAMKENATQGYWNGGTPRSGTVPLRSSERAPGSKSVSRSIL